MLPAFLFLLLTSFNLYSQEDIKSFSESNEWLNLLHYEKTFKYYRSEINDHRFFISHQGQKNPLEELKATLTNPSLENYCRFPARYKLLVSKKFLPTLQFENCTDYLFWKKNINAKSLSLIFAGFYPENPASSFGHLFVKINQEHSSELIDYALNFSASTEKDGSILYAWKGLTGGYQGTYSLEKFYMKINEYEDHESRDLWEYPLELTDVEVDFIVDHIYELTRNSSIKYYFLTQNCSYQILKLFKIVRPNMKSHFKLQYHIPTTDLKEILSQIQLIHPPKLRPSLASQIQFKFSQLNKNEKKETFNFLKEKLSETHSLSANSKIFLSEYFNFRKFKNKELTKEEKEIQYELKKAVAKLDVQNSSFHSNQQSPHLSHDQSRVKIYHATTSNQFSGISFKPAFHDFLESDIGLLSNSKLNVLNTDLRRVNQKIKLWELNFIETKVITPYNKINPKRSWGTDFSYRYPLEYRCQNCDYTTADLSRGLAFNLIADKLLFLSFIHLDLKYGIHKTNYDRFIYGIYEEFGWLFKLNSISLLQSLEFHQNFNTTGLIDFQRINHKINYHPYSEFSLDLNYDQIYSIKNNLYQKNKDYHFAINFYF